MSIGSTKHSVTNMTDNNSNVEIKSKSEKDSSRKALWFGMMSFFGVGVVARVTTDSIVTSIQEQIGSLITGVIDTITTGVNFLLITSFVQVQKLIVASIDMVLALPRGFLRVFDGLVEGMIGTIGSLFPEVGANLLANPFVARVTGEAMVLGRPGIAWAVFGIFLAGGGVAIATFSEGIPLVDELIGGLAFILIVIGATLGAWGLFPEEGAIVVAAMFALSLIIASFVMAKNVLEAQDSDSE